MQAHLSAHLKLQKPNLKPMTLGMITSLAHGRQLNLCHVDLNCFMVSKQYMLFTV